MEPGLEQARPTPRAFISYGWESDEHRDWVRELAARLRADGVGATLDQWEVQPGDQLPAFMERAVRENDYVLIVCTPHYKRRSDERLGGVGYEGDIMTGDALTNRNARKFIPLFRSGNEWGDAAPTWLRGKYYIDIRGTPYLEERYHDLITTLHGTRPAAPPDWRTATDSPTDGSRRPSSEWAQVFVEKWNHLRSWTSMHRPGIARVSGDKVYLNGTTVDEVQKYHRDTLKLALEDTNALTAEYEQKRHADAERDRIRREQHAKTVREAAKDIKF